MKKPYEFKLGDKVKWCGVNGVVTGIDNTDPYPVNVSFQNPYDDSCFTMDGLYYSWHTKPSLKLRKFKKKLGKGKNK